LIHNHKKLLKINKIIIKIFIHNSHIFLIKHKEKKLKIRERDSMKRIRGFESLKIECHTWQDMVGTRFKGGSFSCWHGQSF